MITVRIGTEPAGTNFGFYGCIYEVGTDSCLWSTAELNDPYPFKPAAYVAARRKALGMGYRIEVA